MLEINESMVVHKLNVNPEHKLVQQKKRSFAPERQAIIDDEIDKLLKVNFIFEIHYLEWLTNVVMVKKPNGKWHICINYTDLNKACPKYFYPLPNIDKLIDVTSGHALLSFMDAFSGYNQIRMTKENIPKTSFLTHKAIYAFKVILFGLVNGGRTY